jgi:N-acetylglucosaminyl-diphospho-decaprenol L-rhamnosyltransferase
VITIVPSVGRPINDDDTEASRGVDARVAAVIVEYHSGEALSRCLASLRHSRVDEIIVVDNGAPDGAPSEWDPPADVTLISAQHNAGFGAGVNLGATRTDADFLLICNPDVALQEGALEILRETLRSHPRAGIVGPALLDEAGQVVQSARAFPSLRASWGQAFLGLVRPSGRRSSEYRARNWTLANLGVVDWVTGACFVVRAEAFRAVGGFDDQYFLYVEEVDFCWRLRAAGWDVLYQPEARVTHTGGVSTSAHPYRAIVTHHWSLWTFVRRTTSGVERLALPLMAVGLAVRCLIACSLHAARQLRSRHAR